MYEVMSVHRTLYICMQGTIGYFGKLLFDVSND